MKKILFYCHVFYPQESGYSIAFQNIINSILDNDETSEITVVTPFPLGNNYEIKKERLKVERIFPVVNIPKIRVFANDIFYARKINKLFKKEKYDILFVETFDQSIFLSLLNKNVIKKTVVRIHSTNETEKTFFHNRLDFLVRRFLIRNVLSKRIKWILSTNSYHIEFCKKYYFKENLMRIADCNFFILPNTISINPPESFNVSKKLKIFTLGRMSYLGNNQKGFTDLIYALRLLPKETVANFDITIVGSGDMRNRLIEMAGIDLDVSFIESMSNETVMNKLRDSDVVVLPSRYEGLSMFALEGLATGNICLFSETGGLVDLIDDNGLFFEPQNIESISKTILDISTRTEKELVNMKIKSIKICEEKYSSKVISEKFNVIFDIVTCSK